jgi:hypothetical protein
MEDEFMAEISNPSAPFSLMLTTEERAELERLVEQNLGDTRVEVHRTHTPDYRQQVLQQEDLLRRLLAKLRSLKA